MKRMTPEQCRTARALIGITQEDLAKRVFLADRLVNAFEAEREMPKPDNVEATLRYYFEQSEGIIFLFEKGAACGLRLDEMPVHVENPPLTSQHFKMARAWLGWTQRRLHEESGVSISAIYDFERERRTMQEQNISRIETTLRLKGIDFLYNAEGDPIGIRVSRDLAQSEAA